MWKNVAWISIETPVDRDFSVAFAEHLWYNKRMETVTISKSEYEEFLSQKEHINDLQQRVDFLMAQMRLAKHML